MAETDSTQVTALKPIAYFDVLGYSAYLKKDESEARYYDTIRRIANLAREVEKQPEGYSAKTFSDNVLIVPRDDNVELPVNQIAHLFTFVAFAHLMLLIDEDVLIRGSIVYDNILVDDDIVFGKGLVKAHDMERQAKFPRSVIDDSVLSYVDANSLDALPLVAFDSDGKRYVDFFSAIPIVAEDTSPVVLLERIRNNLLGRIKRECRYRNAATDSKISEREGIIEKHIWTICRFNEYCMANGYEGYAIQYRIEYNQRLMKPEVVLMEQ